MVASAGRGSRAAAAPPARAEGGPGRVPAPCGRRPAEGLCNEAIAHTSPQKVAEKMNDMFYARLAWLQTDGHA